MNKIINKLKIFGLFEEYNLSLNFKETTVLVGDNGIGKTTILKIINGILTNNDKSLSTISHSKIEAILENNSKYISTKNKINPSEATNEIVKKIEEDLLKIINNKITKEQKDKLIKNLKEKISKKINDDINEIITNKKTNEIKQPNINKTLEKKDQKSFIGKIEIDRKFSDEIKKINVCYISNINLSANSVQNITKIDGELSTLLELETIPEIENLVKSKTKKEIFTKNLNKYLNDSEKKAFIKDKTINIKKKNGDILNQKKLSSGENQLIYILLKICNTIGKKSVIILDEPEISLHLKWQKKLLSTIKEINPQSQIIAATHSPALVMDGYMDSFIDLKDHIIEADHND